MGVQCYSCQLQNADAKYCSDCLLRINSNKRDVIRQVETLSRVQQENEKHRDRIAIKLAKLKQLHENSRIKGALRLIEELTTRVNEAHEEIQREKREQTRQKEELLRKQQALQQTREQLKLNSTEKMKELRARESAINKELTLHMHSLQDARRKRIQELVDFFPVCPDSRTPKQDQVIGRISFPINWTDFHQMDSVQLGLVALFVRNLALYLNIDLMHPIKVEELLMGGEPSRYLERVRQNIQYLCYMCKLQPNEPPLKQLMIITDHKMNPHLGKERNWIEVQYDSTQQYTEDDWEML